MKMIIWFCVLFVVALTGIQTLAQAPVEASVTERLAAGILRWKVESSNGRWWQCGEQVADPAPNAQAWSAAIVAASGSDLNPWGMAGIIANESRFDECAIGKKTRDWAYANRLLTPRRLTISHTRADVLRVIRDPRRVAAHPAVDLGPAQMMYGMVYRGDVTALLAVESGVALAAVELRRRQGILAPYDRRIAERPWASWPGMYREAYDRRVVALARALGATEQDIRPLPTASR